jgi:hypothetical protein
VRLGWLLLADTSSLYFAATGRTVAASYGHTLSSIRKLCKANDTVKMGILASSASDP